MPTQKPDCRRTIKVDDVILSGRRNSRHVMLKQPISSRMTADGSSWRAELRARGALARSLTSDRETLPLRRLAPSARYSGEDLYDEFRARREGGRLRRDQLVRYRDVAYAIEIERP